MAAMNVVDAILLEELTDDDVFLHLLDNQRLAVTVAGCGLSSSQEDSARIERYAEDIVPLYSAIDFRSHFRMRRASFEALCVKIAPLLKRERSMTVEKKMMCTLWILGTPECYRSVADRFGISKGTLHLIVMQMCHPIVSMMEEFVRFPETREEMQTIAEGFRQRCGMPGVVGAIDGTHIPIPAPRSDHRASYINRKGFSSMILQVVCDSNLRFLDIYAGWPGSVHDARVFRNSPVSQRVEDLPAEFHLLGDSAYPLSQNLLVPFRDNGHLTEVEKKFNRAHSSTRVEVERAIGLLKCKFRRLKFLDMYLESEIPVVISACCVLHNYILQNESGDVQDSQLEMDDGEIGDTTADGGTRHQQRQDGEEKRLEIAQSL